MKTALAVLLASSLAFADPPADAPMRDLPGRSVHLDAGQPAPFAGRLLSDDEHTKSEAAAADDFAFRKKATSGGNSVWSPYAIVAVVAGSLAVGLAAGAGLGCSRTPDFCGLKKP